LDLEFMKFVTFKTSVVLPLWCVAAMASAQSLDPSAVLVSRVEQDPAALSTLRAYAKEGYREAQFPLAVLYHEGRGGLIKNGTEAAYWFRKAAEQGHAVAQFNLGVMLQYGQGVAKDDTEAAQWYRQAAEQGHAHAQCALGAMLLTGTGFQGVKNPTAATAWFRKAAEQGHVLAQYNLGQRYLEGQGTPKDDQTAVVWLRKAAAQGLPAAISQLAQLYETGQGVNTAPSPVVAYALHNLAAAAGNEFSLKRREWLAKNMLQPTLDDAQALTRALAVPEQFNGALDGYLK
jgi:uncharacterized protein